ncbi:hypothetical protein BGY98DRAFT_475998 [Russula aff. rugulosa BPL654]|nr:hypothetical protein BGY98DRAFT_475998 [Russula aff. rugulosa BPL654]
MVPFGKQAKSHDEAWAKALKDDMDGVLIFAGLFSAVLTAFVVPKIQDLKVDPQTSRPITRIKPFRYLIEYRDNSPR